MSQHDQFWLFSLQSHILTTSSSSKHQLQSLFSTSLIPAINMPGPGSSRIPTLSTMAKISCFCNPIGCFCNPSTTTSSATICNDLLRQVILTLAENAKAKAYEEGFNEGYDEGQFLNSGNGLETENNTFKMLRKEDKEKA